MGNNAVVTMRHGDKTVTTTPEAMEEAVDNLDKESRWKDYQDAPPDLQDLAKDLRDEHHPTLEQAHIQIVMTPKAIKVNGEEVAMKIKLADDPTRVTEGIDAWIIVSGEWYDHNDPRQHNFAPGGVEPPGSEVNRRMCRMALDECLCAVYWDGEKLRRQQPVKLFVGVVKRWGVMPATTGERLAKAIVARHEQGTKFLAAVDEDPFAED